MPLWALLDTEGHNSPKVMSSTPSHVQESVDALTPRITLRWRRATTLRYDAATLRPHATVCSMTCSMTRPWRHLRLILVDVSSFRGPMAAIVGGTGQCHLTHKCPLTCSCLLFSSLRFYTPRSLFLRAPRASAKSAIKNQP